MNLGERIYKYRTAKNMSQGDLADALDVSRQSVSKWETGTAVPELDKLVKLAELFEISLDELVGRAQPCKGKDMPARETTVKVALGIRELIGIVLIGAAVLVAGLGFLIPDFEAEAGLLFALLLATAGVCCIWPLNHFSNIFMFTLDAIFLLMGIHGHVIIFIPFLTIFIIQCMRWLKTLPDDKKREDTE